MAKKVRKKLEEEQAPAFEFPEFDEIAFADKEFEMTYALLLVALLTIALGILTWALTVAGLLWYVVFPLGVVILVLSPFIVRFLRSKSSIYTKGDWAGLLALEFFGWLALWFVLLNLSPHAL